MSGCSIMNGCSISLAVLVYTYSYAKCHIREYYSYLYALNMSWYVRYHRIVLRHRTERVGVVRYCHEIRPHCALGADRRTLFG